MAMFKWKHVGMFRYQVEAAPKVWLVLHVGGSGSWEIHCRQFGFEILGSLTVTAAKRDAEAWYRKAVSNA